MNPMLPPRLWQPVGRQIMATAAAKAAAPRTAVGRRSLATNSTTTTTTTTTTTGCCRYLHRPVGGRRLGGRVSLFSISAAGQRPSRPQEPAEAPQPADDPNFSSILDNPPELVRSGRRHGPGILILVLIPVAAFALGTWQVFRLRWKTDMLAKCEDRLVRPPLPLGLNNVADAAEVSLTGDASDFDYRRIVAVGSFRHDQEMLVGPRVRDGQAGFFVVTPLELAVPLDGSADGAPPATILVNRGWIARGQRPQAAREHTPAALPEGLVRVEGLLRAPWKRNVFTPDNRPDKGEFYFPDVVEMAQLTGSLPVWVEATMEPDLLQIYDMEAKGIPIGKPPEVNIRNSHAQYIFTWYSLSVATSVMLWMVLRKPPSDMARRVRMNKSW